MQSAIDTKSWLSSAANLSLQELEAFAQELNQVIFQKKNKDKNFQEKKLLSLINSTVLSPEKRRNYLNLIEKLENDTITEKEHKTFLQLTTEEETLRNQRVKYMLELTQIKQIPLNQLMESLGLQPLNCG